MTTEKKEEEKPAEEIKVEAYRKDFEELPLEKKIASLLELEALTLNETFSFVLNSPSMIFGKFMDVLAEFGLKMEDDAKKASRPNEHHDNSKTKENGTSENAQSAADKSRESDDVQITPDAHDSNDQN